MNTPKISVLMPAYNAEKYISEAIESILNQTFRDFEFIIVDDCSTDKTWDIIQDYGRKDKRIVASRNEKHLDISETRNNLLSGSRGRYVVWQDADDISMDYRIDHQYNYMETHPEVGISGGFLYYFDESRSLGVRKYATDDKTLRKKIFRYSPVAQPAAIVRKECFAKIGLFPTDSSVAEDLAMSFQIGTVYKFGNIPEILIKYRQVKSGATFSKLKLMEMYTLSLRFKYSRTEFYKMSLLDRIYNVIQYILLFLLPAKIKISLFNLLRNSK